MCASYPLLGYVYVDGYHDLPTRLHNLEDVLAFLKAHLFNEQVIISDRRDELWFEARSGVDLFSRLDELGIDLPELYRQHRQEILDEAIEIEVERQPWEEVYDQVGLSPGEIHMRQRVKKLAMEAKTVSDVASLVEGTYFDVLFCQADGQPAWGYFDPQDFSVSPLHEEGQANLISRIVLAPHARVRHVASGEDIHLFELMDLPG